MELFRYVFSNIFILLGFSIGMNVHYLSYLSSWMRSCLIFYSIFLFFFSNKIWFRFIKFWNSTSLYPLPFSLVYISNNRWVYCFESFFAVYKGLFYRFYCTFFYRFSDSGDIEGLKLNYLRSHCYLTRLFVF
jgi:hypothetical protein